MNSADVFDDLTSDHLNDEQGFTGDLTPVGAYTKVRFNNSDAINKLWGEQIGNVLRDYQQSVDPRRQANLDAHEGIPTKGETIIIPIAKRDTNQQLAWFLAALFSKSPLISVRPLEGGMITVNVAHDDNTIEPTELTTTDEAQALQDLVKYYLEDRIGFKKVLRTWLGEMVKDQNRPPIMKVIHEERQMPAQATYTLAPIATDPNGKLRKLLTEPTLQDVKDGCATRIAAIPAECFFVPMECDDIQQAPFVFQEFHMDTATLKSKIASGEFDMAGAELDEATLSALLAGISCEEAEQKIRQDGRVSINPFARHRLFEHWFYMPFAKNPDQLQQPTLLGGATTDENSADSQMMAAAQPEPQFEWKSLCGVYHWQSMKFLGVYDNPSWTKKRPFFAGYTQQRPHSFSGYSPTENVAPLQNLLSQLFHLQVQNMVMSNVKVFFAKETSVTYKFLKDPKNKLRPGSVVPYRNADDIKPEPLGAPIESMANEITFLNLEAEKMTVVSQFDRGQIPNRTPAQTVQSIENLAKMQPSTQLDCIRESISDCVKMFVQTLIQYAPQGITIPFQDPTTKALLARTISFPSPQAIEQFAFEVTATADDLTDEALFNQCMMVSKEILQPFHDRIMSIGASGWAPKTPPPIMTLASEMLKRERRIAAKAIKHARMEADEFLITEQDIDKVPMELHALQQAAQQVTPQQTGGQPNEQAGLLPPGLGQPDQGAGQGPPLIGGAMGQQPVDSSLIWGGAPGALPPVAGGG